jgi:hypothetical protein
MDPHIGRFSINYTGLLIGLNLPQCASKPCHGSGGQSPRRPGFYPGPVHVGFMVDKVALGQVFPFQFHFTGVPLQGKTKELIIFITGLHNKP